MSNLEVSAPSARTDTTFSVTSGAGGAGQSLGISAATVMLQLSVASPQPAVDVKVGSLAWQTIAQGESLAAEVDLSATTVLVRKHEGGKRAIVLDVSYWATPTQIEVAGTPIDVGGGAVAFTELTDSATADIPTTNTPTANALAAKANAANPVFSGVVTVPGASVVAATAMAALVVDVTKGMNSKTIGADSTFTFSATPSAGTDFALDLTNSDTASHVITIPSSFSVDQQANITTFVIPGSGHMVISWRYTGSGYLVRGELTSGDVAELTVASAATTPIFAAASNNVAVSGTATITAFDNGPVGTIRLVRSLAVHQLTNGANLILPGGLDITTAAGAMYAVRAEGSGVSRVMWYQATTLASGVQTPDWGETGTFRHVPQYLNSATMVGTGTLAFTATGTVAAVNSVLASRGFPVRVSVTGASAAANVSAQFISATNLAFVPDTNADHTPIRLKFMWAAGESTAGMRCMAGFKAAGSISASVEPSTFIDGAWFGADSTDSNLQLMHNDGSGTAVKVDLGSGFPANDSTVPYTAILIMYGGGAGIRRLVYWIKNWKSGATASGTITSELPTAGGNVNAFVYRNSGANSVAPVLIYGGTWGGSEAIQQGVS